MILYHAVTAYHVLVCLIHKLVFHKNDEAIIMVPVFLEGKIRGLDEKKIFKEIYLFKWDSINRNIKGYSKEDALKVVRQGLIDFFGYEIVNNFREYFDEINVCSAAYFFGMWLVENNIEFQWFEEAPGKYSSPEIIMKSDKQTFPLRYEVAADNGMYYGENNCVSKKFINMEAQENEVDDNKVEDLNIIRYMLNMDYETRKALIDFWDIPDDIKIPSESVLLLTQHFVNLYLLDYEEHMFCYQLTADYYYGGLPIYCKLHPSDLMPYENFLNLAEKIPGTFPSELLALFLPDKIQYLASINSTGIFNLKVIAKEIITFNDDYIYSFQETHKMYLGLKIIEKFSYENVISIGNNYLQLINLAKFSDINIGANIVHLDENNMGYNNLSDTIFLIGSIDPELLESILVEHKNNIYIFIGHEIPVEVIRKNIDLCLISKRIEIRDGYGNKSIEYVYVLLSPKEEENVRKMKYKKRLENSGLDIETFEISDLEMENEMLKGILNAVEERLEYYVKENKELKIRLQGYEIDNK